jgi:hypothetical protein
MGALRRRRTVCGAAAPQRCPSIACVAAACIQHTGARRCPASPVSRRLASSPPALANHHVFRRDATLVARDAKCSPLRLQIRTAGARPSRTVSATLIMRSLPAIQQHQVRTLAKRSRAQVPTGDRSEGRDHAARFPGIAHPVGGQAHTAFEAGSSHARFSHSTLQALFESREITAATHHF